MEKSDIIDDIFIAVIDKHKYGKVVLFIQYFTSASDEEPAVIEELLCCDFCFTVERWLVTVHKVGDAWGVILHLDERAGPVENKVAR